MAGDVEAALSLLKKPETIQKWKQENEKGRKEEVDDDEVYDGGVAGQLRGWPLVLAGFLINMLSSVGTQGFGMLFSARLLELGLSPGMVAGVANMSSAVGNILSLPVAPLLHRWGCRRLLLPTGLVNSAAYTMAALAFSTPAPFAAAAIVIGSCRQVMYLVVQVAVCRCFQRGRPLAMGVAMAGATVSQIMVPPLLALMQSYYSPRTTLLIASALTLHICIATPLLPSDPDRSAPQRVNYLAMVKQREVALLCLIMAINSAALNVFGATIPVALLDTGHTPRDMVVYLSMSGVASLAARVSIGLFLCHFSQASAVVRLASALTAATMPVWYWCERLAWRVAWLSVCGGASSVVAGMSGLVVLEVVGLRWQAEVLSLINLSSAVTTVVLGEVVDLVRVATGSYASKLQAMSALLIVSQALWGSLHAQARRPSASTTLSHPIVEKKNISKMQNKPLDTL